MIRNELLSTHRFIVCFGPLTVGFSKISGLSNEYSVETINEGGVNDSVVLLRTPKKSAGTLVFEHGTGYVNPLNIAFSIENLGIYFELPGTIIIFNSNREVSRAFGFNSAIPVKWSVSELDAQNGSVLIDKVELMHQGIFEL